MINITTQEELDNLLEIHDRLVIDVCAKWCGPCRAFAPTFEAAAAANPEVAFVKIDADEASDLLTNLGVTALPTLIVFYDKVQIGRNVGSMPAAKFAEFLAEWTK